MFVKQNVGEIFHMRNTQEDKSERVLSLYSRLTERKVIRKSAEAERFGVSLRTIQRDIADIQTFLQDQAHETGEIREIIFDRAKNGYRLETKQHTGLGAREILAAGKIMLESRALVKEELFPIIHQLCCLCSDEKDRKLVEKLLSNELHHYIELHHGKKLLDLIWELEQAAADQNYILIRYRKLKNREIVERKVKPVGIMFSDFYFYMTAFIEGLDKQKEFQNPEDVYPTIYRLDRLISLTVLDEHFAVPYAQRFEEGEFRKRVQFMYGGKLRKVKFKFYGGDPEFILDRIPTAQIVAREKDHIVISAEVFGDGIDMWFRSQGDRIEKIQ